MNVTCRGSYTGKTLNGAPYLLPQLSHSLGGPAHAFCRRCCQSPQNLCIASETLPSDVTGEPTLTLVELPRRLF